MKNIFLVIFILFVGSQVIAQNGDDFEDNRIYTFTQVKAIPYEGLDKLKNKLAIQLKRYKNEKGIDALIFQFIVEKDGSLSNLQIQNENLSEKNIQKAFSVLEKSKWIPAKHVGKPVRSRFTLPIKIVLD